MMRHDDEANYQWSRLLSLCVLGFAMILCTLSMLRADPAAGRVTVIETDVCTLSRKPNFFRGKMVRVRAHVVAVVEGAYLSDASSKCIVGLGTPTLLEGDRDIIQARVEAMDTSKDVVATVTGEFSVKRGHRRLVCIIDAIKITDLKVTPVKLTPKR